MSRSLIIGDIHGCFYTLMALLDHMNYQAADQLYLIGDLVGKGPHSDLVLDFCASNQVSMVLGNHDLSLLRCYFVGENRSRADFQKVLLHPKCKEWVDYLTHQPFMSIQDFGVLVHAAVEKSWSIEDLISINNMLCQKIQNHPKQFFINASLSNYREWGTDLTEEEQCSLSIEALTRLRYYNAQGLMDDQDQTGPPEENLHLTPWYLMPRNISEAIFFGHWASLKGQNIENAYHLDGGCVYGGNLISIDGHTKQKWEQPLEPKDRN